ncbi:MAG: sugar phosphate nucleotidyltransferase [Candidatus Zhuqueibacterota bacterium]
MIGVIMAGGFGTRLKPLTCNIPKPMVPMVNRPIMEHIVNLLKHYSITETISLLFHQPEKITSYFGDGSRLGVDMMYIQAVEDYGTAGSVKKAAKFLKDPFVVISGDVLTDIDLSSAIHFHKQKKAAATLILTRVKNPLPFGIVFTDSDSKIVRFFEKPTWGQVFSDTINTGIYILEPEVLNFIPEKTSFDFSKDLFPLLLSENKPLYGYISDRYWKDVGDVNEYRQAHQDCLKEEILLESLGKQKQPNVWVGDNCELADNITFDGKVVIGQNCKIAGDVVLSNSVIGDNCRIDAACDISNSVLWDHIVLGKKVKLQHDVVASGSILMDNTYVLENVVVSENCSIGKNASIRSNVKIWPDKIVDDGSVLTTSLVWGDHWFRELFTYSRITGIANSEISPEFAAKVGAAYGAFIGANNSVVSSRDASDAAKMISRALNSGFMSVGVHIKDFRVMPIPVVRYGLRSGIEKGGVHIRKSPFDDKLIDIIFFDDDGRDLQIGKTKAVERLFFREDFRRAAYNQIGRSDYSVSVIEPYTEDYLAHLDIASIEKANYKIVVDYSHGAATTALPKILGSLNCEVVSLNAFLEESKLSRDKEKFDKSMNRLSTIVTSLEADIGFLMDAGVEKLFVVDEKGRIITSDRLLVLLTKLLIEANCPRKIAVPVTASRQIEELCTPNKIQVVRTANRARAIVDADFKHDVQYAGDTQGGFIFSHFLFAFDAMFTMGKILELMARCHIRFGELHDSVPKLALRKINVPCPWDAKGRVMRRLMEDTEKFRRELIDGIKIFHDNDWVLVLPDTERPIFHVNAEASDEETAEAMVKEYQAKILRWINE